MAQEAKDIHVLLVEDNPGDAQLIKARLKKTKGRAFYITHICRIVDLKDYSGVDLDIILLDLFLPDSSGLETLEKAKVAMPSTPIVVLTGSDDEEMAITAMRHGAQDYLVKGSISTIELTRTMCYAIERGHSEELQKRLLHSDRLVAVGQLATGVAHEINNPAAFITANLAVLEDQAKQVKKFIAELHDLAKTTSYDKLPQKLSSLLTSFEVEGTIEEMNKVIKENMEGVSRITTIVKDLQIFGRRDRSAVEMVHLNEVIESASNMVFNEIKHRARLVKDLGELPLIPAHKVNLGQVVVNLLLNAAHAIKEGAADRNVIKIRTRFRNKRIVFSVEDSGVGIPPEIQKRIFDPFFTTKPPGQGTGLGLALCAETIALHQGTIDIESYIGRGTRFIVCIPDDTGLVLPEMEAHYQTEVQDAQKRLRVLLIDDEEFLLKAFKRTLRSCCDVEVAHGGVEGLAILKLEESFDVIICDLMMPEIDGRHVYDYLVERSPTLAKRVVFCTGGAITEGAKEFMATVPNLMLQKPVDPDFLRRIITQVGVSNPITLT